jgi:gliding motility-associated-like protein
LKKALSFLLTILLYNSTLWGQNTWNQRASFGSLRTMGIGFSINGKGYMGLGQNASGTKIYDFWEYNPANNTWTQKANYPGGGSYANCAFSANGKGYVCFGGNSSGTAFADLYEYNPSTDKWTKKSNFPGTARYGASCFVINDTAFIMCGSSGGPPYLTDVWQYIPSTDVWTKKSNFSGGNRNHGAAFTIGSIGYYGTGLKNSTTATNDIWKYNKKGDSWSRIKDFPGPAIQTPSAFGLINKGYFGTGYDLSSRNNSIYEYDAIDNTWTKLTNVPSGLVARNGATTFVIDGVGYIGTGQTSSTSLNDLWSYTPVQFRRNCTNDSTFMWPLNIANLDSVKWNFGDTASGKNNVSKLIKNTFHIYKKSGTYSVKVITYIKGNKDSTTFSIPVKDVRPFIGNDTSYCNTATINKVLKPTQNYFKYKWSTGDSVKSITVKTKGTFILTVIDSVKCLVSDTIVIRNPVVTSKFNRDSIICSNNYSLLKNASIFKEDTLKALLWKISDNTSFTDSVVKKSFSTADSFLVKLIAYSKYGCKDSSTKKVYVNPNANIGFSINKTPQCFNGHDFVYTNTSSVSKGSLTYNWNLGDATTSTSKSISTKTYSKDTTYLVTLITATDKGCKDTTSKSVTINTNPKADFGINTLKQCYNYHNFNYTNSSTISKGSISSYTWNLGDSKTATTQHITGKTYSAADSFKVQLLGISNNGCRDSISKTVTVYPNTAIGFNINKTPQCFNGHDFIFTNTSSISGGNFTNNWIFGDGNSAKTKDIASKKYSKDSTYLITLITTSDKGCNDTTTKSITLYASPKASFAVNAAKQCYKWNLYDYTDGSTIRTGNISQYAWDLGDADKKTTKNVSSKHYSTEDSFKVSLLTVSNFGCRDSISFTVNVLNTPQPNFTINKDTQCFNGHDFSFNNQTKIAFGNFTNRWEFGDLTTDTNKHISTKKYSVYGTYKVLLISTSNNNCKDSISKFIRINASPVTKFAIDKDRQCFRGNVFNYTNQSTIPQGTLTYQWSLGESKKSNLKDILTHKYTTEDSFNVQLIATSDKFCTDTISHLAVTYAQPVAKFVVPQDSQCWQKHYFIIINNTTLKYGTLNHVWNFGDGTYDYTHTPATKRYANTSANYILKYKVTSDHGCTDSAQKKVSLLERPISIFTINDSIQCFKTNNFSFVNKTTFSDLTTITYYWDYGDGSKTVGKNAKSLSYPSPKFYNVQLISSSYLNNCIDTLVRQIIVAPHAKPAFSIDKDSQCFRTNYFTLTNSSTVQFGSNKYQWQFGDNTSDTNTNTTKTYKSGSKYAIKLIATTNYNCKDSISKPIVLVPHPISKFSVADTTLCRSQNVNITNESTLLYGNFNQVWHFDEGADETGFNVSNRKLITPGFHPIRLSLKSNFGCTDTLQKRVYVEQPGTTRISIVENDSQCLRGNSTHFNVTSLGGAIILNTYKWDFGDGNFSTLQNPVYTYQRDSSYKISIETSSSNNCLDTTYFNMVIHPHPVSDFSSTIPCFPNPVIFTNNSKIKSGNIKSHQWEFGTKSNTSNLISPVYSFATDGSFNVKLKTTSNYGCTDSIIKSAITKPKPKALFTYTKMPSPDDINLRMNNQSSSDVTMYNWDFSNGSFSNDENPIAVYTDSGRFYITLSVSNADGCSDTFSLLTDFYYPEFVFYVPTAFSPNGNGVNEIFKPSGSRFYRKYSMEIYNHWGEKMFETTDLNTGWDGTYQGVECPDGVYHCYIWIMPIKGSMRAYNSTLYLLK